MEPPSKRLRLHYCEDVDESNPDYIRDKRRSDARFKGTLENIFARYENLTESASDEIDMVTGEIVVDRGHLRSLDNEKGWKRAQFLDDMLPPTAQKAYVDTDEDSEDELAPSLPLTTPKSKTPARRTRPSENVSNPTSVANAQITSDPLQAAQLVTALNSLQTLSSPQLPKTPASLQAQSHPNAELIQAVKVLTDIASTLASAVNINQYIVTPAARAPATPATDPNWWYPALPERVVDPTLTQSSPISHATNARKRRQGFSRIRSNNSVKHKLRTPKALSVSTNAVPEQLDSSNGEDEGDELAMSPKYNNSTNQRAVLHEKSKTPHPPQFTDADNAYIKNQKDMGRTWTEIRNGRSTLTDLPLWALQKHYYNNVRVKACSDACIVPEEQTINKGTRAELSTDELLLVKMTKQRQLLTPNSLEDAASSTPNAADSKIRSMDSNICITSIDTDDEDMELLSLANDSPLSDNVPVDGFPDLSYDTILPSIELDPSTDGEHDEPMGMLVTPTQLSNQLTSATSNEEGATTSVAPIYSTKKRKAGAKVQRSRPEPKATEDTVDQVRPSSSNTKSFEQCQTVFKDSKMQPKHGSRGCSIPISQDSDTVVFRPRLSTSVDTTDELSMPFTPTIKAEACSPSPSFALSEIPVRTPKSAPQPTTNSSGRRSSTKLSASARLKIRQSWAKAGRKSSSKTPRCHPMFRKRKVFDDTEDELA